MSSLRQLDKKIAEKMRLAVDELYFMLYSCVSLLFLGSFQAISCNVRLIMQSQAVLIFATSSSTSSLMDSSRILYF